MEYPNRELTAVTAAATQEALRIVMGSGEVIACPGVETAPLIDVVGSHAPIDRVTISLPDMHARRLIRLLADYVPSWARLYDDSFANAAAAREVPRETED